MKKQILVFVAIIAIAIYLLIHREPFLEYVRASVNNKEYGVQEELPNHTDVPNKLAKIDNFITSFITYLSRKYPNDPRVNRLQTRTTDLKIRESEFKAGVSSYTVNKGETMSVCVRNKENKDFHDYQLLLFVIIHELGHIASVSYGHNEEFNSNFKWLLEEARQIGYNPINYRKQPIVYCGVQVTNNPLF